MPRPLHGESTVFSTNSSENIRYPYAKNEVGSLLNTTCKNLLKIKDLNVRPKTIKFFEDNIGQTCTALDLTMTFGYDIKRQAMKEKKHKWDFIKI